MEAIPWEAVRVTFHEACDTHFFRVYVLAFSANGSAETTPHPFETFQNFTADTGGRQAAFAAATKDAEQVKTALEDNGIQVLE